MRDPMRSTTPPTVDSTSAVSLVSAPVAGFTRTSAHRAADRLLHELGGRQQVVVEVLLDERRGSGAMKLTVSGHDLRRDAGELDALLARGRVDAGARAR